MHLAPTTVDGCRSVILVGLELKTEVGRQSQAQRAVEADFAVAARSTRFLTLFSQASSERFGPAQTHYTPTLCGAAPVNAVIGVTPPHNIRQEVR